MTPERFQEVRQLFEAALDHRPEDRFRWLGEACSGDRQLYEEVEEPSCERTTWPRRVSRLARGCSRRFPSAIPPSRASKVGVSGSTDIIREVGRGGMGAVYLARRADNLFSKQVALKVVRPERSDPAASSLRSANARLSRDWIIRTSPDCSMAGTTEDGSPYSRHGIRRRHADRRLLRPHRLNVERPARAGS